MKKTVLIFGGSQGIGKATAEYFAEKGYNVAFTFCNSEESAKSIEQNINADGSALALKCDVRSFQQVIAATKRTIALYKRIDALVVCAGVAKQNMLLDVSEDEFDYLCDVNLKGAFFAAKAVAPYMTSAKSGSIVFVSSFLGIDGCSCESVYSLTKGGINAFSKALAKELGASGIRVNTVCPGLIDTKMNDNLSQNEKDELVGGALIRRIGTPNDVARAIYFLAETEYITAIDLPVTGGMTV